MAQDPRALMQKVRLTPPITSRWIADLEKADKAAVGAGTGFSLFGGRTEKWENAADLYTQTANAFRLQKMDKEAGQAFEKAADIQTNKLNEHDDAANTLQEVRLFWREPEIAAANIDPGFQSL